MAGGADSSAHAVVISRKHTLSNTVGLDAHREAYIRKSTPKTHLVGVYHDGAHAGELLRCGQMSAPTLSSVPSCAPKKA